MYHKRNEIVLSIERLDERVKQTMAEHEQKMREIEDTRVFMRHQHNARMAVLNNQINNLNNHFK